MLRSDHWWGGPPSGVVQHRSHRTGAISIEAIACGLPDARHSGVSVALNHPLTMAVQFGLATRTTNRTYPC